MRPILRLYVLRHGEPAERKMFYGHSDVELSARGREQAKAQARWLADAPVQQILSSDLARAIIGAELIAEGRGMQVDEDPAFREMHLGRLEKVAHADALERFSEIAARSYEDMLDYRMPDGGESVRDVADRALPALEKRLARHRDAVLAGERRGVVLYAHNTVNRVVLARAAGVGPQGYIRFAQRYGAISRVDIDLQRSTPQDPWAGTAIAFCNLVPP